MAGKNYLYPDDQLIRKALDYEFESVDAPPVADMWHRVAAKMEEKQVSPIGRMFPWNRLAAVAAVFFMILAGGIGVYYSLTAGTQTPAAELAPPPESSAEITVAGEAEDSSGDEGMMIMEAPEAAPAIVESPAEDARFHDYQDWPAVISLDYHLTELIVLDRGGEPYYHGALYSNKDTELTLVNDQGTSGDIIEFISQLGMHLEQEPIIVEEGKGYLVLGYGDMDSLAWQEENNFAAIIATRGHFAQAELISIWHSLETGR